MTCTAVILNAATVFMLALTSAGSTVSAKSLSPEEQRPPVRRSNQKDKHRFFSLFGDGEKAAKEPPTADILETAEVLEEHQDLGEEITKLMEKIDDNESDVRELLSAYSDLGTETLAEFQERRCINTANAWFPGHRDNYKDNVASASLCSWWCAADPKCDVYSYIKNVSDPNHKRCFFQTGKEADKKQIQTQCCDSGLPCSVADYKRLLRLRKKQAEQEVKAMNKELKHIVRGNEGLYPLHVKEKAGVEQIKGIKKDIREMRTKNLEQAEAIQKVNGEHGRTEAQLESDVALANRHATMLSWVLALTVLLMILASAALLYIHVQLRWKQ